MTLMLMNLDAHSGSQIFNDVFIWYSGLYAWLKQVELVDLTGEGIK